MNAGGAFLRVRELTAGYDGGRVLHGLDLDIAAGEVVTLIGRNGMGKTTAVRAVMGIVTPSSGSVAVAGVEFAGARSHTIARSGLGLVPEQRQIFGNLSVHENLIGTARRARGAMRWTTDDVYEMFPNLRARMRNHAWSLSGGEQQMLAIGRALLTHPQLLILDEATEGLAPLVRLQIWACLARLKELGLAMLVIDKDVAALAALADRHYVIEKGHIVWTGRSAELAADASILERYVGVGATPKER